MKRPLHGSRICDGPAGRPVEQLRTAWRWLSSAPNECRSEQNLEIDQAIFTAYRQGLVPPTIRVYTWDTPVVSLGRLQHEGRVRSEFPNSRFVRRTTGGLAVEHQRDLTVSVVARDLVLPSQQMERKGILASYFLLLQGIVEALRDIGVDAAYGTEFADDAPDRCPITSDCFSHRGRCDVFDAHTGGKLLGSAQRRANGFVLQQMSLRPIYGVDIHSAQFRRLLRQHYQVSLAVSMWQNESEITSDERALIHDDRRVFAKE